MVAVKGPDVVPGGAPGDVEDPLAAARDLCLQSGFRLSTPRLRTLELLLRAEAPVKAYDLAKRFHNHSGVSAITVYRALNFWERLGLVRRVKSLNAFIASSNTDGASISAFFVCSFCGASAEVPLSSPAEVKVAASGLGFEIDHLIVEAGGRCRRCVAQITIANEIEA